MKTFRTRIHSLRRNSRNSSGGSTSTSSPLSLSAESASWANQDAPQMTDSPTKASSIASGSQRHALGEPIAAPPSLRDEDVFGEPKQDAVAPASAESPAEQVQPESVSPKDFVNSAVREEPKAPSPVPSLHTAPEVTPAIERDELFDISEKSAELESASVHESVRFPGLDDTFGAGNDNFPVVTDFESFHPPSPGQPSFIRLDPIQPAFNLDAQAAIITESPNGSIRHEPLSVSFDQRSERSYVDVPSLPEPRSSTPDPAPITVSRDPRPTHMRHASSVSTFGITKTGHILGDSQGEDEEEESLLPPLLPSSFNLRARAESLPARSTPTLKSLGWGEYKLIDGSYYYHHAPSRITTDLNLRDPAILNAVVIYLFDKSSVRDDPVQILQSMSQEILPEGYEMWLRPSTGISSFASGDFNLLREFVHHPTRSVRPDLPLTSTQTLELPDDKRLELEERYWAFMQIHPAHCSLPAGADDEALEALTWSYTDRLLPSSEPVPPPFSQEECHELLGLLRPLDSKRSANAQTVHNRIVSKVLARITQWRQDTVRTASIDTTEQSSDKTSVETTIHTSIARQIPFQRTLMNFVMTVFCWGIPYAYLEPAYDDDDAFGNGTNGLFLGLAISLTATIMLSGSVSFLAVRGIDTSARMAVIISILCSVASLIAGFLNLQRRRALPKIDDYVFRPS